MVFCAKIYLAAYINNQNIWLKNDTAELKMSDSSDVLKGCISFLMSQYCMQLVIK